MPEVPTEMEGVDMNMQKIIDEQVRNAIVNAHAEARQSGNGQDAWASYYSQMGLTVFMPLTETTWYMRLEDYQRIDTALDREKQHSAGLLKRLDARDKMVSRLTFGLSGVSTGLVILAIYIFNLWSKN